VTLPGSFLPPPAFPAADLVGPIGFHAVEAEHPRVFETTDFQKEQRSMVSQTDRNTPPSHKIVQAARDRLGTNPYFTIQELSCECDDNGVLFLRGRLASFYQKQLAQEAVARVPGVTRVVNQAEVVPTVA
jgi:hypothetical protein